MTHFLLSSIRVLIVLMLLCNIAIAQSPDTVYQNLIKEYTTDDRFYPPSISSIYDHAVIPSPFDHFGSIIGAPGVMHRTSEIFGYYKKLAETSSKLNIEQVETSEEGRPIYLVTISSNENIKNLDRYKEILAKLSDPRQTTPEEAKKLVQEGKPVYYLNGGMHSTEMGSPEMLMELAYRLITDPTEEIQHILDNAIILINPVSEPDGRDKQVDWYYRYTKAKTEYDDGLRTSPPYWGKYVFHDNNRDGLQLTQAITKALLKVYNEWHPNVMLDLHESVPLLYISTGTGPYNENVDPITVNEWQLIANYEMTALSAQDMPGVFTWAFYDGWWPGYGTFMANNRNSIGRFYETFGNAGANTFLRDINRRKIAGDEMISREWYRPDPSTKLVYWSSRNNTNYMQAGVLASLTYAADNGNMLLKNFYQKSLNNIRTGEKGDLKMFAIPKDQRDPAMAEHLITQLQRQGIEVHKVTTGEYKDEYAVLLDQPYSRLAKDLLTKQMYPKDAKFPPYDDIAWTYGYMYGVDVHPLDSMKYEKATLSLIDKASFETSASGIGNYYILNYKAQSGVISALYDANKNIKKAKAYILDSETIISEDTVNAGSMVLEGVSAEQANNMAQKHGFDLMAHNTKPAGAREISLPRIAIYHTWFDTQAEGWVRYTLEQKGIPYTSIDKDDLKAGKLRSKFDVIIIPEVRGGSTYFLHGIDKKFGPMPYTKTDEFPSHGYPDATLDMTGGPGFEGVSNLSAFVNEGGVLVPLDNSAINIADLGISRQLDSFNPGGLFHPGSMVTVKKKNNESPILYGYPEVFHVFKGNGRLLNTELYDRDLKILQYGTELLEDEKPYEGEILGAGKMKKEDGEEKPKNDDKAKEEVEETEEEKTPPYLLSGMVRNEKEIIGHGAIFNAPVGDGNVIFFTFNPLHRYLNHHDSGMLWNVLINWNKL